MSEKRSSRTDDLGELFVRVTGESTVSEPQEPEVHAPSDGSTGSVEAAEEKEYRRKQESLSRHEALQDALSEPDT